MRLKIKNSRIYLLCILPFCNKMWIFWGEGGLFQQWEDFHFTKENCQNYGRCTTQNLMQQSKQLETVPVQCQYILLLMSFIISIQ